METLFDIKKRTQKTEYRIQEPDGLKLRNQGIDTAAGHAEQVCPGWNEKAYLFLLRYITGHKEFMTEQVRAAAAGIVPEPPSRRAWGGVIVRAVKSGLLERAGYKQVNNPRAHSTPATLWRVK